MVPSKDNKKNLIVMDFDGYYPTTSKCRHKYIFIMYGYDSNCINAVPLKRRKADEYLQAFQECYDKLKQHWFTAQLQRLDNKIPRNSNCEFVKMNLRFYCMYTYHCGFTVCIHTIFVGPYWLNVFLTVLIISHTSAWLACFCNQSFSKECYIRSS